MLFNSPEYLVFLAIVVCLHWFIPARFRWIILLGFSILFYLSFRLEYSVLILSSTLSSFYAAKRIEQAQNASQAKLWLASPLVFNLGLLFFFKYYDFSALSINLLADGLGIDLHLRVFNWILPVGISFYTFQIISYLLDVYWGKTQAERHLGYFSLYVLFFPKIITGPIERAETLLPSLKEARSPDYKDFRRGMFLILMGYFQKILIADNLALLADGVYNQPESFSGFSLVLGILAFAFQMYTDFSGYTDIALGSALLLGIRLSPNFNRPFMASSITDFWRRWHISLSSWANDYLYKPIAFNRRSWGNWGVLYAVTATFFFLGIWHGPRLSFLLFGFLMGMAFYYELRSEDWRKRFWRHFPESMSRRMAILLSFLFFTLSSVFFRGESVAAGWQMLSGIFSSWQATWPETGLSPLHGVVVVLSLVGLHYLQGLNLGGGEYGDRFFQKPRTFRWVIYLLLALAILNFGEFNENQFIYVEF